MLTVIKAAILLFLQRISEIDEESSRKTLVEDAIVSSWRVRYMYMYLTGCFVKALPMICVPKLSYGNAREGAIDSSLEFCRGNIRR